MSVCIKIIEKEIDLEWRNSCNYFHFVTDLLRPLFSYLEKNNLQIEQVLVCANKFVNRPNAHVFSKNYNIILEQFGINQCYKDCECLEIQIEQHKDAKPLVNFVEKYILKI